MENDSRDYYNVLGVEQDATQEHIDDTYHRLAKKYNAGLNNENQKIQKWSQNMMAEINQAYSILKNPQERKQYDERKSESKVLEKIYIQTWEQAKVLLVDRVKYFAVSGPTDEMEERCLDDARKLICKQPAKYIKRGIPNEYSNEYLMTAAEYAVSEAGDQMSELYNNHIINNLLLVVVVVWGSILSYQWDFGFDDGFLTCFKAFSIVWVSYFIATLLARFIARGFKSNLAGVRGLIVNGLIAAILLYVLFGMNAFFVLYAI